MANVTNRVLAFAQSEDGISLNGVVECTTGKRSYVSRRILKKWAARYYGAGDPGGFIQCVKVKASHNGRVDR